MRSYIIISNYHRLIFLRVLNLYEEPSNWFHLFCPRIHLRRSARNQKETCMNQAQDWDFYEPWNRMYFLSTLYRNIFFRTLEIWLMYSGLCHLVCWLLSNTQVQDSNFLYKNMDTKFEEASGSFGVEQSCTCSFVFWYAVSSSWW